MLLLMLSILLLLGRRRSKTNTRAPSQVQYKSPLWKIKSWIFAPRVPTLPSRTGRRPDQYYHHPSISPRRIGRWRHKCRCRSQRLLWRRRHDPGLLETVHGHSPAVGVPGRGGGVITSFREGERLRGWCIPARRSRP